MKITRTNTWTFKIKRLQYPSLAVLNEDGEPLRNEDGSYILNE